MSEPKTTAIVLKGIRDIENVKVLGLQALKTGHRVVVTADYNGEKSHVFTAVRQGPSFQLISIKGRGRYFTESRAISAGMSAALDFFTWDKPS